MYFSWMGSCLDLHIFETKNKWPKAQHFFKDEGLMFHWAKFHDSAINFNVRIKLKFANAMKKKKNISAIQLRRVSEHSIFPGSGLADFHLKKPIRLNHQVWTINRQENGCGYCFKSKVFIAAKARNFNSTLVTLQWVKQKLAEQELDKKIRKSQVKLDVWIKLRQRQQRKLFLRKCARQGM